jgi:hypothetical protein
MLLPNAMTIFRQAGLPGRTTSRANSSASITTAPHCRNIFATVLFPVATPPVKPTSIMAAEHIMRPAVQQSAIDRIGCGLV